LELTEKGLGPLTSETAFSVSAIQKLLPSLRVVSGESSNEGVPFPIIKVMDRQTKLFDIGPSADRTHIASFAVTNNLILYRGTGKIGATYAEIFGNKGSDQCGPGKEELTGKVICYVSAGSHVLFLFDGNSQDDTVPPISLLRGYRVIEIWWHKD
jgi:hypothetical protein